MLPELGHLRVDDVRVGLAVSLARTLGEQLSVEEATDGLRERGFAASARLVGASRSTVRRQPLQRVSGLQHLRSSRRKLLGRRDVPAERICEADDHAEQRGNVNGVGERFFTHAGGHDCYGIRRRDVAGTKRELLEESERGPDPRAHWCRTPVLPNRLPHVFTEGVRRDRAV